MGAMTPMRGLVRGPGESLSIWTEDYSGIRMLVCIADNKDQQEWLLSSLGAFHKVAVLKWEDPTASRPGAHERADSYEVKAWDSDEVIRREDSMARLQTLWRMATGLAATEA